MFDSLSASMKTRSNGSDAFEGRQHVGGAAEEDLDLARPPRRGRGSPARSRDPRLRLDRDDAAAVGDAARHPDRRVGAERADLEHALRARDAREQVQQLAVDRRDLDRRAGRRRSARRRRPRGRDRARRGSRSGRRRRGARFGCGLGHGAQPTCAQAPAVKGGESAAIGATSPRTRHFGVVTAAPLFYNN